MLDRISSLCPISRRDALRWGIAFTGFTAASPIFGGSREFWDAKPSTDWNAEEIDRLLTKSPWAKEASVSYNGGPGGYGGNRGGGRSRGGLGFPGGSIGMPGGGMGGSRYPGGGYPGGSTGGGYPGSNSGGRYPGGDDGGREQFRATVRWESALPIQQALHLDAASEKKIDPEFTKYYVIQVLGDLPDMGARRRRQNDDTGDNADNNTGDNTTGKTQRSRDDADEDAQAERRLDMFKQYTKIERKGDFLNLEKVEQGSRTRSRGPGTLFYFSRLDDISLDDRLLTFVTKMGPVEIKAKFTPKEMMYQGKLAV